MAKGRKTKNIGFIQKNSERVKVIKKPTGRLISWSPWPPANFQTRYPAFPLVTSILILIFLRWISIVI